MFFSLEQASERLFLTPSQMVVHCIGSDGTCNIAKPSYLETKVCKCTCKSSVDNDRINLLPQKATMISCFFLNCLTFQFSISLTCSTDLTSFSFKPGFKLSF